MDIDLRNGGTGSGPMWGRKFLLARQGGQLSVRWRRRPKTRADANACWPSQPTSSQGVAVRFTAFASSTNHLRGAGRRAGWGS